MKNILILCSIALISLACIDNGQENNEQLYMCRCEQDIILDDSSEVQSKDAYIYLVYSEGTPDCCSNKLATKYKGYHETWQNAESHPRVWKRTTNPYEEIDASDAMTKGCNIDNKVIAVYSLSNASHKVKEYYPEVLK